MATRLNYAGSMARILLSDATTRLRHGGLASTIPAPPGAKPFVIVTGPGRSGTSAVARVLHESGLPMGTQFDPPNEYNATGYYEDMAMRDVNNRIIGDVGLADIQRWRRWPWRSMVLAVAARYRQEMEALAAMDVGGWKDPTFCTTLEPWLRVLRRRPKIVICLRSPEAFLRSVVNMIGLVHRQPVEGWWANELRRLLDVIRDYRLEATCIEYDELVQHPEETVAALAEFVGHPLDPQYVEASLRQFLYPVPRRYARLYEEVRSLSGRPPRHDGARPETEGAEAVAAYLERVRAIDARIAEAKSAWAEGAGMPDAKLQRNEALEETRAVSEAYVATLREAQAELGQLIPPAVFERYHELTRQSLDHERLMAQLMLHASQTDGPAPNREALDGALTVWQRYCAPAPATKVGARRARECERAVRASGCQQAMPS